MGTWILIVLHVTSYRFALCNTGVSIFLPVSCHPTALCSKLLPKNYWLFTTHSPLDYMLDLYISTSQNRISNRSLNHSENLNLSISTEIPWLAGAKVMHSCSKFYTYYMHKSGINLIQIQTIRGCTNGIGTNGRIWIGRSYCEHYSTTIWFPRWLSYSCGSTLFTRKEQPNIPSRTLWMKLAVSWFDIFRRFGRSHSISARW